MNQHEYYIRQPADTESHGPFTLAQLSDLAKSGGLNASTLYFDADADQWRPVADAPELAALVAVVAPSGQRQAKNEKCRTKNDGLAIRLVVALLAASGLALVLPAFFAGGKSAGAFATATVLEKLQGYPYLWLGALDFLFALCCLAFGARFFAMIRIRAGLGIGFLGALFWLQANMGALAASLIAAVCLWLATTFTSARALAINAIAGLAALALLAYCLLQ